jgi:hypothetical protein
MVQNLMWYKISSITDRKLIRLIQGRIEAVPKLEIIEAALSPPLVLSTSLSKASSAQNSYTQAKP